MSNEDPTKELNPPTHTTQPTMAALMERINFFGDAITQRINKLEEKLQGEIAEVSTGIRRIERKIEVINGTLLAAQADNRDFRDRLEQLESRAS